MAASGASVLIVDSDTEQAQRVALSLDGLGFEVAWSSFSPHELSSLLKDFKASLLVVHAEVGSTQLAMLLARMESLNLAELPVALVCQQTQDQPFVQLMKTGVVELVPAPFNGRLHGHRLRNLLDELSMRTGVVRGKGLPGEVNALIHHVMRTRRTGGLTVGEAGREEGRATFVRGVLKSARLGGHTMQGALGIMAQRQVPFTFTENSDASTSVVEFDDLPPNPQLTVFEPHLKAAPPPEVSSPSDAVVPVASAPVPPPPPLDAEAARTPLLFVDDEPAVVTMLASYFSKKGYPVSTASDGVEAMRLLVSRRFAAVVADLNMPQLDGWGLLRLVREDLRTSEVPVALFSAQDAYRETLKASHAGAQAFFPKTLKLSALELQVRELCEPRRRFERLLSAEGGLVQPFGQLGPQFILQALSQARFTGVLEAKDGWARWVGWLLQGRLVQLSARAGGATLWADRALSGFLLSRESQGTLGPATAPAPGEGFGGQSTEATLSRVVPWLNDEQRRLREDELARARALTVDAELYRLYATVGPPAWLPIAKLLCEERLAPAEVMQRLGVAPLEVAAVVKDLLRRGVAALAP